MTPEELASRIHSLTAEIELARAELTLIASSPAEMEEELARIRTEMADVKKETAERAPPRSLAKAYVVVVVCLLAIDFVGTCR